MDSKLHVSECYFGEPSSCATLLEPHGDLFLIVQYLIFASDVEDIKSLLIKFAVDKD